MANKLQQRGEQIANAWQTDCNNVANKLRMRGKRIATTWRTICNNVANIPQMRGERIATMQHSKNKNHTFVTQKPPFCTSKTILLHVKNHTFVMRICNIQKTNTLQTFHKCVANTPKWVAKHSAIYPRTPTKLVANTPPGVGADSSRPYPNITKNAYSHNQICISLPHFVGVHVYAGTINRTPTAANRLRMRCKRIAKHC